MFDVLVGGKWWLGGWENTVDVATKLGLFTVPYIGEFALEDAVSKVRNGFYSQCAIEPYAKAEGLVGRTVEALFDKKGSRLIVKLKTKDF